VERLWQDGRVDEAYFLDRYAAGVVERLAAELGACRSPGTGGIPMEEQHTLFSYLAPLKPDIEMFPSGMMSPRNSLLAQVFAFRGSTTNPCRTCDHPGCAFRRKPE
jgi:hypothetical protein